MRIQFTSLIYMARKITSFLLKLESSYMEGLREEMMCSSLQKINVVLNASFKGVYACSSSERPLIVNRQKHTQ